MRTNERARRCVLLVEDEIMIAMMLQDRLEQAGYRVLCAATFGVALKLAREASIDIGVLDVNLCGKTSFPVADALRERGIGFVFASGYGIDGLPPQYRGDPILQKPYETKALLSLLAAAQGAT